MRHLENTGLLILSSFFFLFYIKPDYFFICSFLLCLSLCCANYFSESKKLHLFLCIAFIVGSFLIPRMILFFPAIFYVLILDQHYILPLHVVFFIFMTYGSKENILLFLSFGEHCFLSLLFVCKPVLKRLNN